MGKEKKGTPLKLYADGSGGIYYDPEEVLNDPEFQRKAEEFDEILDEMFSKEDSAGEAEQ